MSFLFVFLAVGFGETIGQILLIRELLVNFQGNELSLGVILAFWLLMISVGSWVLGKLAPKFSPQPSTFVFTVILHAFILFFQLLLSRWVNIIIGVRPGEIAGLASIFLACVIVLTPLCLLHGFQFPFAGYILSAEKGKAPLQVSRLYISEALGSMAGGICFAYFLVHYFDHLEIAVMTVFFNLVCSLFLLRPFFSLQYFFRKLAVIFLALLAIISLGTGGVRRIDFFSSQWQWRGHELVFNHNSVYQNITVTRKGSQLNFFTNGMLLFTSPVPDIKFVEEISHFPLLYHPYPRNVLLIGGGMGGELEEILRHSVDNIFYVEPDPQIIHTIEKYLPQNPFHEARITVVYTDGRLFVERTGTHFDLVIMNLPPPSTLQVNRFYTHEFFKAVRNILAEEGIFAFGLPSSEVYMSEEMVRLNQGIYTTLKEVFPLVVTIPNDFTLFLASQTPDLFALDTPAEISRRFDERGPETRLFTSPYIEYKLSPERISRLTAYLEERGEINHDLRPMSTFHNLALWNAMFHPRLKSVFDGALQMRWWWFLPLMLLFFLPVLKNRRRRQCTPYPLLFALFTSGFAGMTFTIVLLFVFQVAYGNVYQKIGIITAAFMLGVALGGWTMSRFMGSITRNLSILGWLVLMVALYAFLLSRLVPLSGGLNSLPGEVPFAVINLIAGLFVGWQFPLANKIYLQKVSGIAPAVGLLYAADLWGGMVGAVATSVFLLPILGVVSTCWLVGALSLTSSAVLFKVAGFYPQMPGRQ